MRLLRVQVPEFRALKDVDISFESDFTPQVFPLGSLNGGGKSTLLQLIFILLNLKIEFLHSQIKELNPSYFKDLILDFSNKYNLYDIKNQKHLATIHLLNSHDLQIALEFFYGSIYAEIDKSSVRFIGHIKVDNDIEIRVYVSLIKNMTNITTDASWDIIYESLEEIKNHVFLVSPSSQPHIFLSREENRLLFTSNPEKTYDQVLKGLKDSLPNFYTYDFIDVLTEVCRLERDKDFNEKLATGIYGTNYEKLENSINSLFIDGKKIIPLTVQQKRHTKDSIQSMGFKLPSGEEIYPEDLSHGELKRLAIFVLIKYHEIKGSIVLFDEIENGFHPRWQRYIVDDLVEWGATNQYILATHSYEVCRNLTFEHIKELSPRLFSENQE